MAKNTGRGARTEGAVTQPQSNGSTPGIWKRNAVTGRFTEAKRAGGAFKNTRRGG